MDAHDMSEASLFWRDAAAQNDFYPAHGVGSPLRLSSFGDATSRRLQSLPVFVLGSLSLPGICAVDLSRELARHRSLSALAVFAALPLGDMGVDILASIPTFIPT